MNKRYLWAKALSMVLLCSAGLVAMAQEEKGMKYTDASELTLIGKVTGERGGYYHRVDTASYPNIPVNVKNLLTRSAGLAVVFKTNSKTINAKWCTSSAKPSNNMTAIAYEGLDLYIKREGRWQYAGVGRPSKEDCTEFTLVGHMDEGEKECLLYLPLYDETISLEIGVENGATISASPNPFRRNIVLYGSSIVQGSSASRPGMAYPARLSRATDLHIINLGVSGNAKMERAVGEMIAPMEADAFILDCVPNTTPEEVTERTAEFIRVLRSKHPGKPIVAIQSIVREVSHFNNSWRDRVKGQNENFLHEISLLQQQDPHLYLITADGLLGDDHEGTVDGTHPNDIGFDRMLNKIHPEIEEIFRKYGLMK